MATPANTRPLVLTGRLAERMKGFLSSTRVGIDFGEYAGGIAIVRGNDVLHAEAFLDFHDATIEQRRGLRRGRRSRHSKKLRLARLRSWVLRQKIADERLPDPYRIMRALRLMPPPGIYRHAGASPHSAVSWIESARNGQGGAEAFVKALTLVFQKRGYAWDAIALAAMSDEQLKGFLASARVPPGGDALVAEIQFQIDRRRSDPAHPVRGKKKVVPEELESLLQLARERGKQPPQPRIAEHRSVKEAEIGAIVQGFGKAAGLAGETIRSWQAQLCGLLNRILRPARFENRLKTGCAWCGKATPRKQRVREFAYRAAVHNLRKREGRIRPLTTEEAAEFLAWWDRREEAPGVETIKKRLVKLGANQEKMARQLYDLLKDDSPTGRASLCLQHLKMAANGKTMKDAGVEWQRIAVRKAPNPCRERRDARVLHRLEELLFHRGKTGIESWRHGPVAYITLEIPDPDTLQMAKGKIAEKNVRTLKERLADECGPCLYSFLGGCIGETDKDHIFPRSRGGPDIQQNLVSACVIHNKEKGDRTPWEWLGTAKWADFERRVAGLKLWDRKRDILLSDKPDYPESDPTSLARIGARPRQFIVALGKLFENYRVPQPRADYKIGEPLVQRVEGRETAHFRRSWCRKLDGSENFPLDKDRSTLFNHAEDAALLAAIPPHTWRDLTKIWTAERRTFKGEMKPRPGLVLPQLAPDWAGFLQQRKKPICKVLGRYPVNWKTKFADLTFWREPEEDTPRLKRFKLLKDLRRKDLKSILSESNRKMAEEIADRMELGAKGTLAEAAARQIAGAGAKAAAVQQAIPAATEKLRAEYPQIRRVQVSSQKGGTLARITPSDGSSRKVQIKPASEGAVIWQIESGRKKKTVRTQISILRPRPLREFGFSRLDPPLLPGAVVLGQLRRHQVIWLEPPICPTCGYYRVTKLQEDGITVVPEEMVPAEVLRRIGVKIENEKEEEGDNDQVIRLGKEDLRHFFKQERKS